MPNRTCPKCGYDLAGVPDYGYAATCPECGACCTPLEAERLRWRRRRWLVPLTCVPSCTVAAFAISLLTLAIVPSEPTWLVVALIVLLAGIASGVVCGRTWAESFGYDRGRTTLGAILVAWLIGVLCGAMTIAPLLAAFAWFALRSL